LININPNNLTEKTISKSVNIYAPINGFVSKVNVNIGKYVNPSDVLFELINPSDIHLNLKIFEKDVVKLQIGQKLFAYTNNEIDKKHLCEILLISKDLSAEHTADVHCHFENYDKNLLPGMYMNAEIEVKNTNAFTLPEDAIVNFEGKNFLFIAKNANLFLMTEVKIGNHENGFVEIVNNSDFESAKIVTKGAYTLLMKLKNKADE
jgi:cobalt-zinc-cadmium efflux system membrane fusion protein